jgi:prophage regulatory protein
MSSPTAQSHPGEIPLQLRFLRMSEVENRVGLNKRTIQRMVKIGSFPQPVRLHERSIGFVQAEVERWMTARLAAIRCARHGQPHCGQSVNSLHVPQWQEPTHCDRNQNRCQKESTILTSFQHPATCAYWIKKGLPYVSQSYVRCLSDPPRRSWRVGMAG